jgi:hypothetical protein
MELGVFYQFFQVQGVWAWSMEEPENESVCPAGVPALDFPGRRIISVVRQQDVKIADGDVWVFVRPPVRDNDPAASRE